MGNGRNAPGRRQKLFLLIFDLSRFSRCDGSCLASSIAIEIIESKACARKGPGALRIGPEGTTWQRALFAGAGRALPQIVNYSCS